MSPLESLFKLFRRQSETPFDCGHNLYLQYTESRNSYQTQYQTDKTQSAGWLVYSVRLRG